MKTITPMNEPNFVLLYVDQPEQSATFYAELLGKPALETSPTFVMFALRPGMLLGLWSKHTVEPVATTVGGHELCFPVDEPRAVDATHAAFRARGLPIVQEPTDMDFGRTFVALDPDGHRLRVFAPKRD